MERIRRCLRRLLGLHPALLLLLTAGATAGLGWVFVVGREDTPAAIAFYTLSAYALCAWAYRVPALVRWARGGPGAWLGRQPLYQRYRADIRFRGSCALYSGLASSLFFAAFKLCTALLYRSVWLGAIAAYYAVLALIRALLVRQLRRRPAGETPEQALWREWRGCRRTGWLMLLLTAAMSGMVVQMVRDGQGYAYPGYIIYVTALYAFYTVIMAVVNLVRFRGAGSPLLFASKAVSLAGAAMSILALQTAMLTQFGTEDALPAAWRNALTGTGVLALCFGLSIGMLWRSRRILRNTGPQAGPQGGNTDHGR